MRCLRVMARAARVSRSGCHAAESFLVSWLGQSPQAYEECLRFAYRRIERLNTAFRWVHLSTTVVTLLIKMRLRQCTGTVAAVQVFSAFGALSIALLGFTPGLMWCVLPEYYRYQVGLRHRLGHLAHCLGLVQRPKHRTSISCNMNRTCADASAHKSVAVIPSLIPNVCGEYAHLGIRVWSLNLHEEVLSRILSAAHLHTIVNK